MRWRIYTDTSVVGGWSYAMKKKFDAVQFMRTVRDQMTEDLRDMSFEEQQRYIEQRASKVRREMESQQEVQAHSTQG